MSSPDNNASTLTAHLSPLQRGPAATALRDLALAVGWSDLRVLELAGTQWAVIVGHKRKEVRCSVVGWRERPRRPRRSAGQMLLLWWAVQVEEHSPDTLILPSPS
jgi:hypothetical protein